MGRHKGKWVYILKDATLAYRQSQIDNFIVWWNEGQSIKYIARKLEVAVYEAGLLVIHCELEDLILPREGGLMGTVKHQPRKRVRT